MGRSVLGSTSAGGGPPWHTDTRECQLRADTELRPLRELRVEMLELRRSLPKLGLPALARVLLLPRWLDAVENLRAALLLE